MNAAFWLRIGAIWGFLAVSMGAFGAHGLQDRFRSLGEQTNGLTASACRRFFKLPRSITCIVRWQSWL